MKRYMVDIEALGDSCIIQIGAASFDKERKFKLNINPISCEHTGGTLDAKTVLWWLQQSLEAIRSVTKDPLVDEVVALAALKTFISDADEIWCHSTYDFVNLASAYKRVGAKGLSYTKCRDIRTLTALGGRFKSIARTGLHHDALDDCLHQIDYCTEALKALGVL